MTPMTPNGTAPNTVGSGEEITALRALPERKPGMRMMPTGRAIAQEWDAADDARRREMLAEFEVRVVLHPTGHDPRVAITGTEITPNGSGLTAEKPAQPPVPSIRWSR
jgi:site-specific DNA recombinase